MNSSLVISPSLSTSIASLISSQISNQLPAIKIYFQSAHFAPDIEDFFRGLNAREAEQAVHDVPKFCRVDGAAPVPVEHVEYPVELVLECLKLKILDAI